jgi:hypothetical protein
LNVQSMPMDHGIYLATNFPASCDVRVVCYMILFQEYAHGASNSLSYAHGASNSLSYAHGENPCPMLMAQAIPCPTGHMIHGMHCMQKCLRESNYQQHECQGVIDRLYQCCETYKLFGRSPNCAGLPTRKKTRDIEDGEVSQSSEN